MNRYEVHAIWSYSGTIIVEAENEEEAKRMAYNAELQDFDSEYLYDTFEIDDWHPNGVVLIKENVQCAKADDDPSISVNSKSS